MIGGRRHARPVDIPLPTAEKNFGNPKKRQIVTKRAPDQWVGSTRESRATAEFERVGSGLAVEFGNTSGRLSC
jgi:hypothetical protein